MVKSILKISEAPQSVVNLILENGLKSIVEVGVYRAGFCSQILRVIGDKLENYWLVDPWDADHCTDGSGRDFNKKQWDDAYMNACRLMVNHSCIKVLRMSSEQASKLFENKSVDLVYIDASHEFIDAFNDINLWKPKIRTGGVISGHDFGKGWSKVRKAVETCFQKNLVELHKGTVWSVKI